MWPDAIGKRRTIVFSVVVLPAPFAPIIATISPRRTSSETPFSALIPPYATAISFTQSRVAPGFALGGGLVGCVAFTRAPRSSGPTPAAPTRHGRGAEEAV